MIRQLPASHKRPHIYRNNCTIRFIFTCTMPGVNECTQHLATKEPCGTASCGNGQDGREMWPREASERGKLLWCMDSIQINLSAAYYLHPWKIHSRFRMKFVQVIRSTWFDGRGDRCHQNGFIHEHKNVTEMGLTHAVHAFNFLSTVLVSFWHIFVTKRIITASTSQFLSTLSWRIAIFKISN